MRKLLLAFLLSLLALPASADYMTGSGGHGGGGGGGTVTSVGLSLPQNTSLSVSGSPVNTSGTLTATPTTTAGNTSLCTF